MATFDGRDLKEWRKKLGVTAEYLAERISCDVTTLYRYENGKIKPDPDVMYWICRELGDTRKWQDWMRTEYPQSYGRVHPAPAEYDFPGSILSLYAIVNRVDKLKTKVFTDAADGDIDNENLRAKLIALCEELISTTQAVKELLPEREGGSDRGKLV